METFIPKRHFLVFNFPKCWAGSNQNATQKPPSDYFIATCHPWRMLRPKEGSRKPRCSDRWEKTFLNIIYQNGLTRRRGSTPPTMDFWGFCSFRDGCPCPRWKLYLEIQTLASGNFPSWGSNRKHSLTQMNKSYWVESPSWAFFIISVCDFTASENRGEMNSQQNRYFLILNKHC